MNIKIEAGAKVQITDKPIYNILGDVVQHKEVHIHSEEMQDYEEVINVEQPQSEEFQNNSVNDKSGVKAPKLDIKTPEAKLISLLSRDWFDECTSKKDIYTVSWRSKYIKALMKTFGTQIAKGWAGTGSRNKQNLIKGHILGALKIARVIEGTNTGIARKALNIGVNSKDNEGDKIAPYMSHLQGDDESKQNPYIDWTLEYVKNNS